MEKYRVKLGDVELLVYEKSFRLKNHYQTVFLGRKIEKDEAVKMAAMFQDFINIGKRLPPERFNKRTTKKWSITDAYLVQENEALKDTVQDLEATLYA